MRLSIARTASWLALCLALTGCPLHWVVQDEGSASGERVRVLLQRHREQLERAVARLNQGHAAIPVHGVRLLNDLGFELAGQSPVLAIYTNGRTVPNNLTRFQRAAASFGDDADTILQALASSGLLEPNPDYRTLKLGAFFSVKDSVMESEIGGALTTEPESAVFFFPLAAAKAYAERRLAFKALMNQATIQGDDGQPLQGHLY